MNTLQTQNVFSPFLSFSLTLSACFFAIFIRITSARQLSQSHIPYHTFGSKLNKRTAFAYEYISNNNVYFIWRCVSVARRYARPSLFEPTTSIVNACKISRKNSNTNAKARSHWVHQYTRLEPWRCRVHTRTRHTPHMHVLLFAFRGPSSLSVLHTSSAYQVGDTLTETHAHIRETKAKESRVRDVWTGRRLYVFAYVYMAQTQRCRLSPRGVAPVLVWRSVCERWIWKWLCDGEPEHKRARTYIGAKRVSEVPQQRLW